MSRRITRRHLLSGAGKVAVAAAASPALGAFATQKSASVIPEQARPLSGPLVPAYDRLDEFIDRHMREINAPGMTVALANRDGLLRVSTYGFADVKGRVPVTPETLYQIGSISKSFVAIALLQLRDEGKLDLHKPVTAYLPWLEIASDYAPITAHHLISHTSGLFNTVDNLALFPRGPLDRPWVGFAPGERFYYSNTGYLLLGYLLEELDKRSLAEALRARVLAPLGMAASEPVITNGARARLAVGYAPFDDDKVFLRGGPLAEAPWFELGHAAGSVAATPADMGAYMQMLLNRGRGPRGRLLSDEGFELLVRPVVKAPIGDETEEYGYGLIIGQADGRTIARHTGGTVAFSSSMVADLTDGLAAFASVNARLGSYRPNQVARYALEVLRAALGKRALPPLPESSPSERTPNAADYAGTYTAPGGEKLVFAAEGGRLLLVHRGQRVGLERVGEDHFAANHPEFDRFPFGFGREKKAVVEVSHGPGWYAGTRYAGPRVFEHPKAWEAYTGQYRSDSPWASGVRVVMRKGRLWLGGEDPLVPLGAGLFRVGEEAWSPERVSFDRVVNGKARRMNLSGMDFSRAEAR